MLAKHRAFTLVELLVTIAIISLLLTLLLPALASARGVAMRVKCVSVVRTVTMANILYSNSNDGYLAPAQVDYNPGGNTTNLPLAPGNSWTTFYGSFDFLAAEIYGNDKMQTTFMTS